MIRRGKVSPRAVALAEEVLRCIREDGTSFVTNPTVLDPFIHTRKPGGYPRPTLKQLLIAEQIRWVGGMTLTGKVKTTTTPPSAWFNADGVEVMREYLRRVEEYKQRTAAAKEPTP